MSEPTANFKLYPNVHLGEGCELGDFVVVGIAPRGRVPGELETVIGPGGLIRSHTVIYAGNRIGARFQAGHGALVREENEIGDDVSVGSHAIIEHHVRLGNRVRVHSAAFVPEFCILEDDSWVGPHAVLTNVLHPLCPEVPKCIKGATLRRGAKIGAGARILPAIEIGEMAIVAAGAVVTRDVPARMVVAGNPARVVKSVDELTCPWDYIAHPYPPPGGGER